MQLFKKNKPFYQKKKWIIFFSVIAFLVVFRMILPGAIRLGMNSYLKDYSPTLTGRVDDVDLAILRGVYSLHGIHGVIKKSEKEFVDIKSVETTVLWRDLFKGMVVADVVVDGLDFTYSNEVLPAVKEHLAQKEREAKEKGDDDKEKKMPENIKVGRFDLRDSTIRTDIFPSLTREQGVVMTQLEARATNLIPSEEAPRTPFSMQGVVLGSGVIKSEGEAKILGNKPQWTVDYEMKNFDLTALNRFLKKKVPLTFTRGKLDLYAEAASGGGPIRGYIKPFVKNLDVIKSNEQFLGAKHWLIEIVSALGNVVMEADQTMATRVPFVFDQVFKPESDEAISKAFQHGFTQQLNRGIENSISLENIGMKQSQQENK